MKPETQKTQTIFALKNTFKNHLSALFLCAALVFASGAFGSNAYTPVSEYGFIEEGGNTVTVELPVPAGANGTTAVIVNDDWQIGHPNCNLSASLSSEGRLLTISVEGSGDCIPYEAAEIGIVNVYDKNGAFSASYLVVSPDGGSTILAINIE